LQKRKEKKKRHLLQKNQMYTESLLILLEWQVILMGETVEKGMDQGPRDPGLTHSCDNLVL
jgi:hypothetical protein